jgi:hypothetical protein
VARAKTGGQWPPIHTATHNRTNHRFLGGRHRKQVAEHTTPLTHSKSLHPPVTTGGSCKNRWRKATPRTPTRNRSTHQSQQVARAKTGGQWPPIHTATHNRTNHRFLGGRHRKQVAEHTTPLTHSKSLQPPVTTGGSRKNRWIRLPRVGEQDQQQLRAGAGIG